jgi:uncharacterized protein YozE (UPF0346 family)
MPTIAELEDPSYLTKHRQPKKFSDFTEYFGVTISPYNHPKAIAQYILNVVQHTKSYGAQIIASQGSGKTTIATVLAHHIHMLEPAYRIVWGDAEDFKHLDRFLDKQQKYTPSIFIFDDISGALKEMPDKEMQANFQTLTKIRWIMDPEKGTTPTVVFTTGHYSRTTEKSYRALLPLIGLANFSNEEQSNIDLLAPKDTFARVELLRFKKIAEQMFSKHEFYLRVKGQEKLRCETDNPLRPFVVLVGTNGYTIVYSKDDVCALCSKRKTAKFVDPKIIFDKIYKGYGSAGVTALKLAMYKRGKFMALGQRVAPATDFLEKRLFPTLTTDFDGLVEQIFIHGKKKVPTRLYHKRKMESEILDGLQDASIEVETEDPLSEDDSSEQ